MTYYDDETQPDNLVAVEEPLSALAQLRIDLETFENIEVTMSPFSTEGEWTRFADAQNPLYDGLTDNYHMLFDALDAERKENARLRKVNGVLVSGISFYADEDNYRLQTWDYDYIASEVQKDEGEIARITEHKVLELLEGSHS